MKYNPNNPPDPADWLAADEHTRLDLVEQYHRRHGNYGESLSMHATIHTVVENQLAEGVQPAQDALARLQAEGLDRHESIHAIGCVVTQHLFDLLKGNLALSESVNEAYFQQLSQLTRQSWYDSAE